MSTKATNVAGRSWWGRLWSALRGPLGAPERRRVPSPESTQDYVEKPALSLSAEGARLRVGVVSTRGNVREHNEDNFYVPGVASLRNGPAASGEPASLGPTEDYPVPGPPGLFIVADGMGGQQAGERASQMAVELIPAELLRRLPPEPDPASEPDHAALLRAVKDAIARANEEILAQSHLQPEFANMGTTVVLALFRRGRAYVSGLGDSRAYHLHEGKFDQLTKDHSLANALGEAGTIRPEEVETHKFKHVLYLFLGSKDVGDGPEEVRVVEYRPGDQFLLASDGLTGVVRDETIAEVLRACDDPQRAAQQLVNRALENRSKDNITCVVIKVV
jgi:protein phosphatase